MLTPDISFNLQVGKVLVYSVFAVAYAGCKIVTAWWGERIGARRVLTRIVVLVVAIHGSAMRYQPRTPERLARSLL